MNRVVEAILDRTAFQDLISKNTDGVLVFKMGADWCGPCKKINPLVHSLAEKMPDNVAVINVDVDESFDLYAWMKTRKQVNGIPALLAYYPGNETFASDYAVFGGDESVVNNFFTEIHRVALTIK
jgi:thiol-disulfide isomerase/thioredoxin